MRIASANLSNHALRKEPEGGGFIRRLPTRISNTFRAKFRTGSSSYTSRTVSAPPAGFDEDFAPIGHRVPGIDHQVENHLILRSVGKCRE